jgi:hypothetical protein
MAKREHDARQAQEDGRTVAAAINAGRFSADSALPWLNALKADREGTKRLLGSLAPGLPSLEEAAADAEMERVHNRVLASLGLKKEPSPRAGTRRPMEAARLGPV